MQTNKMFAFWRGGATEQVRDGFLNKKAVANQCSPRRRGDPYGNRTHITAVKGRCLNLLTNGPGSGNLTRTDDTPGMNRMLYQLSYAAINVPYLTGTMYYKGYSEICQLHLCAFS